MRISRLEIQGFKSFVDRVDFRFDSQITGIVGPNGCGKSNVVDAIRWVMGERSTRNLRGRTMEDVIFSGSESRPQAGLAEVTITFDNAEGTGPPEYAAYPEISVSRRLFRTGEAEGNDSEYFINKTQVRLRDVEEFFLGTGVGTKAYSIVEQGKIGSIVNARPEDRRLIIEEAAGITKYRSRRRATERQMEATRQNLLRVSDVLCEIEKNLANLKRQADKAARYKRYRAEMRDLELYVATHRFLELRAHRVCHEKRLESARASELEATLALSTMEADVEALRVRLDSAEADAEKLQGRAYEIDNTVKLLESELSHRADELGTLAARENEAETELSSLDGQAGTLGEERAALAASLSEHEAEVDLASARRQAAEEALSVVRVAEAEEEARIAAARREEADSAAHAAAAEGALRSLDRQVREAEDALERARTERTALEVEDSGLEAELQTLSVRVEELRQLRQDMLARRAEGESRLAALRTELTDVDAALEGVRSELAAKRSRFESLVEIHDRHESLGRGARAAMERPGHGVRHILADALRVPADLEVAVAAVLGDRTQGILVDGLDEAVDLAVWLAEGDRGRATALPLGARPHRLDRGIVPDDPAVLGELRRLVDADGAANTLVEALFDGVLLVRSLADAVRLLELGDLRHTLVTPAGEILEPTGALTGGGRPETAAGLLSAKRETDTLEAEVARLDVTYRDLVVRRATLSASVDEVLANLGDLASTEHRGDLDRMERELAQQRLEERRGQVAERIAGLAAIACEAAGRLAEAAHERSAAEEARRVALAEQATYRADAAKAEEALVARREEAEGALASLTDLKVAAAQAREKAEAVRSSISRVEGSLEDLRVRIERLRAEVARGAARQGEIAARLLLGREELAQHVVDAREAHEAVSIAREECDRLRMARSEREGAIRSGREALDEAKERIRDLDVQMREVDVKLEHVIEQVGEKHRIDLRSVLGDHHMRPVPEESVNGRIEDLHRLIDRMGEINLTAIDEYKEQAERQEKLSTQKQDLEKALANIEAAIRNLNRESRRRFKEAFEAANERFQALFPRLFRGGRARLELCGSEDLLEAGVEIFAQPPGKRLGSIELMSGGEKALTAVSLIFAIFQWKPSPFCLLDEVDAPLDEANVDRFGELVRSLTDRSQFILITHSKRTMQVADGLYGITMQEPGVSRTVSVRLRDVEEAAKAA